MFIFLPFFGVFQWKHWEIRTIDLFICSTLKLQFKLIQKHLYWIMNWCFLCSSLVIFGKRISSIFACVFRLRNKKDFLILLWSGWRSSKANINTQITKELTIHIMLFIRKHTLVLFWGVSIALLKLCVCYELCA